MKQPLQVTSFISGAKKLKLFCRFNGQFHRRPPYNKLRYVGGETRVITVERNLTFLKLVTRIYQLCPNLKPFCLKYKLVLSNSNSDWDPPLVSIECDDDVKRMIEESEEELILYRQCGNNARLWLYVCSSDNFGAKKTSRDGIRCCLGSDVPIDLRDELSDQCCGDSVGRGKLSKGETSGDFVNCVVGPRSRPLNPKDGNLMHCRMPRQNNEDYAELCGSRVVSICDDANGKKELSNNWQGFINNVNRENIMPWGMENPWSYGNQIEGSNNRVRNHQIYTYQIQSQKNMVGVSKKNHRALCLDGRLSAGRYSGLRPIYISNSLKPDFPGNVADIWPSALKDVSGVTEEQTSDSVSQSGHSNSTGYHSVYHTGIAVANQSLVCENYFGSMAFPVRALDSKSSKFAKKKNNGISDVLDNLCRSIETTRQFNAKLINTSEGNNYTRCSDNGYDNLQGGVASTVDLLYNSSLSSSKEVQSSDLFSIACDVAFNTLLKAEIKPSNLLDERKVCTSSKADYAAAITYDLVSRCGPIAQNDCMPEEEIQQDPPSGLIINEQADTNNSTKGSKVIGGTPNNLAAFYAHVATKELQAIKYSDIEFVKELGSGAYGTVYHGKWKGSDVAVKKLKLSCFTGGSVEEDRMVADFCKEAHILGQLHHPNIVAFYGVITDGPANNLATVTEYMVNGSLRQVLRKKDRTIDRRKRLIIAMDAAFGMEYLHEKNIVHFDLKSHNLLVNMKDPRRPTCKIGDLGLSKIKKRTLVSGGVRGTVPWMAPELFNSKNNMVTEKVDVYSFGVVMWELLTGEEPYANLRSEEIIAGIIKGTQRPEVPIWCDPSWRSLMVRCWSSNPNDRPSFLKIVEELRNMAALMNIK